MPKYIDSFHNKNIKICYLCKYYEHISLHKKIFLNFDRYHSVLKIRNSSYYFEIRNILIF